MRRALRDAPGHFRRQLSFVPRHLIADGWRQDHVWRLRGWEVGELTAVVGGAKFSGTEVWVFRFDPETSGFMVHDVWAFAATPEEAQRLLQATYSRETLADLYLHFHRVYSSPGENNLYVPRMVGRAPPRCWLEGRILETERRRRQRKRAVLADSWGASKRTVSRMLSISGRRVDEYLAPEKENPCEKKPSQPRGNVAGP